MILCMFIDKSLYMQCVFIAAMFNFQKLLDVFL